jgi:hypothetical protein
MERRGDKCVAASQLLPNSWQSPARHPLSAAPLPLRVSKQASFPSIFSSLLFLLVVLLLDSGTPTPNHPTPPTHTAPLPPTHLPASDVWASMGQKDEADYRRQRFQGFQVGT